MNAQQAREYLKTATETETGRQAIRQVGLAAIISQPESGDDSSSVKAAEMVRAQLHRAYPSLFGSR